MPPTDRTDPWRRWWAGLTGAQRDAHRRRQGQPLTLYVHELVEDVDGGPAGIVRTEAGTGSFYVPQHLLDEPEGTP